MTGVKGRSGGARRGAGRKHGSPTDRAAMAEKSVLFQLERQLARPPAEQDRKAIRELVATLKVLHRHKRYTAPAVKELERPHVVVMAPPVMSVEEWNRVFCPPPADEPPANTELAARMEAVAAPKPALKPRAENSYPQPPILGYAWPGQQPLSKPPPAELDLGEFMRQRAQQGRRLN
jgi:hypothetical protein